MDFNSVSNSLSEYLVLCGSRFKLNIVMNFVIATVFFFYPLVQEIFVSEEYNQAKCQTYQPYQLVISSHIIWL